MVSEVMSGMVQGVEGELVTVQTDISDGLPVFYMTGSLSYEVKEARERVRTAIKNAGFRLPPKRISVNFAPADIRKTGTFFDLPIAVALFAAMGLIPPHALKGVLFLGELSLDGRLLPLQGVLPILKTGLERGYRACVIPRENQGEASLLGEMRAESLSTLKEVFQFLKEGKTTRERKAGGTSYSVLADKHGKKKCAADFPSGLPEETAGLSSPITDFAEVRGQKLARRAVEIAVAGFHNLLLDGPPGVGKSMLASCVPGIMPEMTLEEKIETTMIYSVKGLLGDGFSLVDKRPYRAPAHSITMAGMFGGGAVPKPGEISLAHNGALFLDEFSEYKRDMIEMFRIPLEDHKITQIRNHRSLTFPADFILIAAANPCPCGYYPDRRRCRCSPAQIRRYRAKLSGPIQDRMDLFVRCEPVSYRELTGEKKGESSGAVRKRIRRAWDLQRLRRSAEGHCHNGRLNMKETRDRCRLDKKCEGMMQNAYERFRLSGRAYYRILRVARTIADLEGDETIREHHLEEALMFRHTSCGGEL